MGVRKLSFLLIGVVASIILEVTAAYVMDDIYFVDSSHFGHVIYPGTKWCGIANKAANYDDLGEHWKTDSCCREHDHCSDLMLPGESKHGLKNDASYTRLNCSCDEKFRKCLRDVNTVISHRVGWLFFDYLATECFRMDYPIVSCKKRGGFMNRKCIEYEYNTDAEQKIQWFYVKNYKAPLE